MAVLEGAEDVLRKMPHERATKQQERLREWVLAVCRAGPGVPQFYEDLPEDRRHLCFAHLRAVTLAPYEQLLEADYRDDKIHIVLRGELRTHGGGSGARAVIAPGGTIGQLDEYHHAESASAGSHGCLLGALDYAHSLAAHSRTMAVATSALQKAANERSEQEVRVLLALLEDIAFFRQLPTEGECRNGRLGPLTVAATLTDRLCEQTSG